MINICQYYRGVGGLEGVSVKGMQQEEFVLEVVIGNIFFVMVEYLSDWILL